MNRLVIIVQMVYFELRKLCPKKTACMCVCSTVIECEAHNFVQCVQLAGWPASEVSIIKLVSVRGGAGCLPPRPPVNSA
jgi:hypothetical protein